MKYDPDKHHRRSIRLKGWDYSQRGSYYVTICTKNRECLLGDIQNDKMKLNKYGKVIYEKWNNIIKHFNNTKLDEFGVMPNHIHGILFIIEVNVGAKHSNNDTNTGSQDIIQNASPLHNWKRL